MINDRCWFKASYTIQASRFSRCLSGVFKFTSCKGSPVWGGMSEHVRHLDLPGVGDLGSWTI